jgi:hypothetical protein
MHARPIARTPIVLFRAGALGTEAADAGTLALTFEAALLAPRWPDFAAGLEVLAHDITTERMVELPNDNES